MELSGRVVVVTGAGGGLGPSVVTAAASAGARLALVDVDASRLEPLRAAWPEAVVAADSVDLLDGDAVDEYVAGLEERVGAVDTVWHLVGGWRGGTPFEEQPLADWALLHDLLVRSTVHVARAFTPALVSSGRGRFAIVSSPQATRPTSDNAAYAAMKAAAEAVVLALADRLSGAGGTANVVVVQGILTPAMREQQPGRVRPGLVGAEDIATALVYLAADASAAMNGQRLRLTSAS